MPASSGQLHHLNHHVVRVLNNDGRSSDLGPSAPPSFSPETDFCDIGADSPSLCHPVDLPTPSQQDRRASAPPTGSFEESWTNAGRRFNVRFRRLRVSTLEEAYSRGKWLLGLLIFQSLSSVVLERYEALIKDHIVGE